MNAISYELDVIIPRKSYFSPNTIKMIISNESILLKKKPEFIEIPFSSINDIRVVRSLLEAEKGIYIKWSDQELQFGIASMVSRGEIDIDLTEKVAALILALKDNRMPQEEIKHKFSELEPQNISRQKRWFMLKAVFLLFIMCAIALPIIFIAKSVLLFFILILLIIPIIFWIVLLRRPKKYPGIGVLHQPQSYWDILRLISIRYSFETRNYDAAIRKLLVLIEKYPDSAKTNWILVVVYYRKKSWIKAKEYCQKVLSLDANYPNAQRLLNELNEIIYINILSFINRNLEFIQIY